jgi:chemotaxis methyl-accepting protein methylase
VAGERERTLQRAAEVVGALAGLAPEAWVLAARVQERMAALGLDDARYRERLASGREGDELVELLRVGETRFFRHPEQLETLSKGPLGELRQRLGERKSVRAWSAGCASGEEPLTLAMLLARAMPAEDGWKVEVIATDLSRRSLEAARRASYSARVAGDVPDDLRRRFFAADGARWRARPELTGMVRYEQHNLLGPRYPSGLDVILCRNVLIYFDEEAGRRTAARLGESLAPGGYLLLGHAESLRKLDTLATLEALGHGLYKRPLAEVRAPRIRAAAAPVPVEAAEEEPAPRSVRVVAVMVRGRHTEGAEIAPELRRALLEAREVVRVDLDEAEELGDEVAILLRRARAAAEQAGLRFEVTATRAGPKRWLRRHGLGTR